MSSTKPVNRVDHLPGAFRADGGTSLSDRDAAVYVEDGWIFRVKPGTPIECVRDTSGVDLSAPGAVRHPHPAE
jgi:hypothetical protein